MIESFNKRKLEEQIDLYVNGRLSPEEIDELWAELIQSDYHLDYLKSVASLKKVVEKERKRKESIRARRTWTYAAAAAFILVVATLFLMNTPIFTGGAGLQPVETFALDSYRSADGNLSETDTGNVITEAITLANTGRFESAVALLKEEIGQAEEPAWISELNLTLGSLYYNEGRYREALSHYTVVLSHRDSIDSLTLEKAHWYLGNTYFQMDEMELAQTHIEKAYQLNGAYRRVARSYLNALTD